MTSGYCMKCRSTRQMDSVKEVTTKNNRKADKGVCTKCGTVMFKLKSNGASKKSKSHSHSKSKHKSHSKSKSKKGGKRSKKSKKSSKKSSKRSSKRKTKA